MHRLIYINGSEGQACFNAGRLSAGKFAGEPLTEADEMSRLADALYHGDTMVVDPDGVIHLEGGAEEIQNGTTVSNGKFAGEPLTEADEMSRLADALYHGDTMVVDKDGVIHLEGGAEEIQNGTTVSNGKFADVSRQEYPEQWYNKNDWLFHTEVAVMRERYPRAGYNFLQQTGNMYWVIELRLCQTGFTEPWKFILVYDKDHPHNRSYGGSIKACPVKPSVKDLERIAEEYGRPGVPHLLRDENLGTYLCTRRTEDVQDGIRAACSAAQVAAWAADWAIHFELGMRDKRVWNQWCDDEHFGNLKI